MTTYKYKAVRASQAPDHDIFCFAAHPHEVLQFSEIERVGRDESGELKGFQRHQVAAHIKEIRDYLGRKDYLRGGVFHGEIRQHTNPKGVLSDTAMQKLVMNSAAQGAIREFINLSNYEDRAISLLNEFFEAVRNVFGTEWVGMNPKTSRLRHGAGLVAMGFVMEHLYSTFGATMRDEFEPGLQLLRDHGHTAWTSGQWKLSDVDIRPWNGIQNTPSDIDLLANHLVRSLKRELRRARRAA
jgi:hypothetical protein